MQFVDYTLKKLKRRQDFLLQEITQLEIDLHTGEIVYYKTMVRQEIAKLQNRLTKVISSIRIFEQLKKREEAA